MSSSRRAASIPHGPGHHDIERTKITFVNLGLRFMNLRLRFAFKAKLFLNANVPLNANANADLRI